MENKNDKLKSKKSIKVKSKKEAEKLLNRSKSTQTKKVTNYKPKNKKNIKRTNISQKSINISKESKPVEELEQNKKETVTKNNKTKEKKVLTKEKEKIDKSKSNDFKIKIDPKKAEIKKTKVEQKKEKTKETSNKKGTKKITTALKNKIFEEVDINESKVKKQDKKKSWNYLIVIGLLAILCLSILIIKKYNNHSNENNPVYESYIIGDKVLLNDNSAWYVIDDSASNEQYVTLLKETQIDINNDGKFDNNDKKAFNKEGNEKYDSTLESSIAYYLEHNYKGQLEEKIGKVKEISLLTSKEFVKIRTKMGYGYEWSEGNWLANDKLGNWWLNTSQNEKIYTVSRNGSYKMNSSATTNYVRPKITIEKENIKQKG